MILLQSFQLAPEGVYKIEYFLFALGHEMVLQKIKTVPSNRAIFGKIDEFGLVGVRFQGKLVSRVFRREAGVRKFAIGQQHTTGCHARKTEADVNRLGGTDGVQGIRSANTRLNLAPKSCVQETFLVFLEKAAMIFEEPEIQVLDFILLVSLDFEPVIDRSFFFRNRPKARHDFLQFQGEYLDVPTVAAATALTTLVIPQNRGNDRWYCFGGFCHGNCICPLCSRFSREDKKRFILSRNWLFLANHMGP